MIKLEKAKNIINQYLREKEIKIGEELILINEETIEKDFGWVFFYNSKKGIETGHFTELLYGNAPLIVDRENGDMHETGTVCSIEIYIEAYQKAKSKRNPNQIVRH